MFVQPIKACAPTEVTLAGIVSVVKPVQFWNAFVPMLVTLLGKLSALRVAFL
jgi:hypothetical protein